MSKCEGCGKAAPTLQCPKCKELGVLSLFCGQQCFKDNWATHKAKHSAEAVEAALNTPSVKTMQDIARAAFKFTGELRPGLITPIRKIPAEFRRPDYATTADGSSPAEEAAYKSNKIAKLSGDRLDQIRAVCRIGRKILDAGVAAAGVGVTTDAIDAAVHRACMEHKVYPSTMNYYKFPKSCCTSVNEIICHGIPDSYALQEGDIVNIDVSCYSSDGVHADLNETVFIGKPDDNTVRLVHACYMSLLKAIKECVRPDNMYKHIGDCIEPFVNAQNFSVVREITGHGIGELFHCNPNIPHYANNKSAGKMAEGHVLTIEPMINAGRREHVLWPDNWTVATADGKRSAQFEHMMVVTATGAEVLTFRDGDQRPHYQLQLEAMGIPLPTLKEGPAAAAPEH